MSGNSFALALLGLALFYVSFEFALIAMMTYMGGFSGCTGHSASSNVGSVFHGKVGSLVGPGLYQSGFWFTCLTSVILNVAAFLIFYFFLKRSKLSLAV